MKTKIALVTGSTRGIGKAISDTLKQNNWTVIDNSRDTFNIGTVSGRKGLVNYMYDNFSKLDLLVNNAAYTKFIPHEDLNGLSDSIWDEMFNVNLKAPFSLTRDLQKMLLESPKPNVINIGSVAGITGNGSNVGYCALKAGIINMTKSLARSIKPIRVNCISPGLIKTDFVKFPDKFYDDTISKTPVNRIGQPQDIADAVLSILRLKYMTGENIVIDGGRTLN